MVLLLPYVRIWACVTSSDIIPYGILRYNTMGRRCGQYSVTNFGAMLGCQCDVSAFDLCWVIVALTFDDRCVDLRRSMVGVSTFEDR